MTLLTGTPGEETSVHFKPPRLWYLVTETLQPKNNVPSRTKGTCPGLSEETVSQMTPQARTEISVLSKAHLFLWGTESKANLRKPRLPWEHRVCHGQPRVERGSAPHWPVRAASPKSSFPASLAERGQKCSRWCLHFTDRKVTVACGFSARHY